MNSFSPVPPNLIDQFSELHDGYPVEFESEDTPDALEDVCRGEGALMDFPDSWRIDPSDWANAARENDDRQTWPVNYIDRFTVQSPTHECTCHSDSTATLCARNAQRAVKYPEGPKAGYRYQESGEYGSVWPSPLSVYAEANPGQWGGANIRTVLGINMRRGYLPDKTQPKDYGFKHYLQGTAGRGNNNNSSGPFVRTSQFPSGWQETAKLMRAKEVIIPGSWEEAVCCVLNGRCVCVGRNGHAIPWAFGKFDSRGNLAALGYVDSYDVIRYDSLSTVRSAWRGSYCIVSVTTPDDWSNPAGS